MTLALLWSNFVAYSLQIGLLVGVAALAPAALRLRSPHARLAYWHLLLAACLVLPAIRPWRQQMVVDNITVTSRVIAVGAPETSTSRTYSPTEIAIAILIAGAAVRLVWLGVGFWKLGRYRRRSQAFRIALPWPARAELRLSPDISGPVTFGVREPVILLPPQFPALDPLAQQAILCHELLHVERRDWLFTVAEELVRAIFWFHPAIWWLLGEIQLAREQAVDRQVIELTQAKDEYVDALLAIAGAKPQLDLAPAPLFLRKRHLKRRVVSIFKEVRMSKARSLSALAASVCTLVAACWLVTNTFPLAAAPQVVNDATGVSVDIGGAALRHRTGVEYPEAARAKGVQGAVVLELALDSTGAVSDARVISGPEELRKGALQSALQWHFAREVSGSKRTVTISYQLPTGIAAPSPTAVVRQALPLPAPAGGDNRRRIKSIRVVGLSDQIRDELLASLPAKAGDSAGMEEVRSLFAAVMKFDEHLRVGITQAGPEEVAITISAPGADALPPVPAPTASVGVTSSPIPGVIRVGGNVQSAKLIRQPRPVYPPEAKEARIQGVVKFMAVIAKDGTMKQLDVISGHPLLVPAALESVKQWVYQTTLLNGEPVEVQTQIDVNFTLSQ